MFSASQQYIKGTTVDEMEGVSLQFGGQIMNFHDSGRWISVLICWYNITDFFRIGRLFTEAWSCFTPTKKCQLQLDYSL